MQADSTRYEIITHEDPETGDLVIPFPEELMNKLGWKEGDEITWQLDKSGAWILSKK